MSTSKFLFGSAGSSGGVGTGLNFFANGCPITLRGDAPRVLLVLPSKVLVLCVLDDFVDNFRDSESSGKRLPVADEIVVDVGSLLIVVSGDSVLILESDNFVGRFKCCLSERRPKSPVKSSSRYS